MKKSLPALILSLIVFSARQLHAQNFISASTNASVGEPNCVTVADVNGDNRLDLISPDLTDGAVLVFTNKGGGTFAPPVSYQVGNSPYWGAAADVNGEGKVDLIAAENYDDAVVVFTNNDGGIFGSNAIYGVPFYAVYVVAADLNNYRQNRAALISKSIALPPLTTTTKNVLYCSTTSVSIKLKVTY